jgi:hypothetical protein
MHGDFVNFKHVINEATYLHTQEDVEKHGANLKHAYWHGSQHDGHVSSSKFVTSSLLDDLKVQNHHLFQMKTEA